MRWTLFCEASALLSKLLSAGAAGDYDYSGADTNSGARARSSAVELRTFNPGVVGSNPTGPSICSRLHAVLSPVLAAPGQTMDPGPRAGIWESIADRYVATP